MPRKDDGVTGDLYAGRSPGDEAQRALPPGSGAPSDRPLALRSKTKKKQLKVKSAFIYNQSAVSNC